MKSAAHRVILDRGFDRSLAIVLDAFLHEGFTVEPTIAGDLHRAGGPGQARRYASFDAGLAELNFCAGTSAHPALLGCRVSIFEMTWACTLVTMEEPVAHYPLLAALVPRITHRIDAAVRSLEADASVNAA